VCSMSVAPKGGLSAFEQPGVTLSIEDSTGHVTSKTRNTGTCWVDSSLVR
jgi:hypothetical protein